MFHKDVEPIFTCPPELGLWMDLAFELGSLLFSESKRNIFHVVILRRLTFAGEKFAQVLTDNIRLSCFSVVDRNIHDIKH